MPIAPQPTLKDLRRQRATLQTSIEIRQLERAAKLLESANTFYPPSWLGDLQDLLSQFKDGMTIFTPLSTPADRAWGRDFPILQNETQLAIYRMSSRILCATNSYAQGILSGLTSYVIGDGFKFQPFTKGVGTGKASTRADAKSPLVKAAGEILDEFMEREVWADLEAELFSRCPEDGEYLLRHGLGYDDRTWCRTAEPEQLRQQPGTTAEEGMFGIRTPADDSQKIFDYWFCESNNAANGERVPAEDVVHCKINSRRQIKRGMPDFYGSTFEALDIADKLRRFAGEGAAVREAIAYFRQHEVASRQQVADFSAALADPNSFVEPFSGRPVQTAKVRGGQVVDIDKGQMPVNPPASGGSEAHMSVLTKLLESAAQRWNAPAWLASADASATNYASSLTAESPFVKWVTRRQRFFGNHFVRTMKIVLRNAAACGRLPADAMEQLDVKFEGPVVETRDTEQQARVDQIYSTMGEKSLQTISLEQGRDYEEEQDNIAEHQAAHPPATPGLGLPGDGEGDDTTGGGGGGGNPNAPPKPPHPGTPAGGGKVKESEEPKHKGKGPGGGQFTGGGGGGGSGGSGGGVEKKNVDSDPRIGKKVSQKEHAAVIAKATAKFASVKPPTDQEKEEAAAGLAKLGANKYRRNLVGNSSDRKKRREKLLAEFGDGKVCPCVYCGITIGDHTDTLEQDKMNTTAQGGRYRMDNLVPACKCCNGRRGDMPFEEALSKVVKHAGT